ncbi:cadherin domain-containing protein [Roseivirga sp.]|uniref:cadherin domain-containing protein n=1 Tax=Roseivirga sp. TaxID=1964215 RepID=UPI003B5256E1
MKASHFSCLILLCLFVLPFQVKTQTVPAWAQDLDFEYLTPRTLYAGLDGNPKLRVRITNNGSTAVNYFGFDFRPDNESQNFPGCATHPNGGFINLEPGESTVVAVWSNCYFGDGLVLPEGTSEHVAEFRFSKDNDEFHIIENFTIVNDRERTSPELENGENMTIAGTIRVAGGYAPQINLKVRTEQSQEFNVQVQASGPSEYAFSFPAADRDDWYLVVAGGIQDQPEINFPNKTVKVSSFDDSEALTIDWAPLDYEYQVQFELDQAIVTPTGFWRGAVSESEQTVTFIPGQENWFGNNDTEKNVHRVQSTIYKYNFAGEKLWEYQPGYECWGGDMSPDGSRVVYQLVPNGGTYGVGVLDGADGSLIWKKEFTQFGPVARSIEGLEAVLSNDASLVAVGTVPTGVVTLFNTETGDMIMQVPNAPDNGDNWGQIRKMAFDSNDEYLYVGSGDNYLRKVRVSDGQLMWRAFIGGWPFVNGLQFSSNESFIITGTKSFDQARVNTATGETVWINDSGSLEAALSANDELVINFGGHIMDAATGEYVGFIRQGAESHFIANDELIVKMDRDIKPFYTNGKALGASPASGGGQGGGEQSQWSYVSEDGSLAIIAYRDMVTDPGNQIGIAFYSGSVERLSLDPNDDPTDVSLSASNLDENNAEGVEVGELTATDPDTNDSHTFELVSGVEDNDKFAIDGNKLLAVETLNFEEKSSYSVKVMARDVNNAFVEKTFEITVNDVNDDPSTIDLDHAEVTENADSGQTVGALTATDEDANDTHTFSLVAGDGDTDNASFTITDGVIKAAESFNFEEKNEYSILVRADDGQGGILDQQVTINVTNANDDPTDIGLSETVVSHGAEAGAEVGAFSTTDEDADDTYTYTLVSGTGSDDNASFTISEDQLLANTSFDFNIQSEYTIRVRSTDTGGAFTEKAFTLTVEIVAGLEQSASVVNNVYPIPATEVLHIEMASESFPFNLSMYDLSGNMLKTQDSIFSRSIELNVSQMKEGIYLLTVQDGEGRLTRKKVMVVK